MAYMLQTSWPVGPNTGPSQAAYMANLAAMYSQNQGRQGGSMFGGGAGGGGGGGGSGRPSPYDVPGQYLQAYNDAKQANEQRYQDILTGYQDRTNNLMGNVQGQTDDILTGYENRYQRGMSGLEGLGDQEKRDLDQRYQQMGAANQQDLVNRGLTGSTILPTMRQGVERERADALSRVNERLQQQRLGLDASLSGDALSAQSQLYDRSNMLYGQATGDTLQFAERRSDTYPDFNQLAALSQAYGAGGGAMGGMPFGFQADYGYQLPQMVNGQIVGQPMGFGRPMGFGWNAPAGGAGAGGGRFLPPMPFGDGGRGVPIDMSTPPLLIDEGERMSGVPVGDAVVLSPDEQAAWDAAYGRAVPELYQQFVQVFGRPPRDEGEVLALLNLMNTTEYGQAFIQPFAPGMNDTWYPNVIPAE